MAIFNFLFGNRQSSGFNISGVVELQADLTIKETHERNAETTDHPVEDGSFISDHIIIKPETVQLEGFLTDSRAILFGNNKGRTQNGFDLLETLWAAQEVVTLITAYKNYDNMVITNITMPRERPSSMIFTMRLKKIKIVSTEFVNVNNIDPETGENVLPETDLGRQNTNTPSENSVTQSRSLLNDLLGGF